MQAYTALLDATEAFNKELEIEDDDVLRIQSSVSLKTLTLAQDKIDPASLNGLIAFEFSQTHPPGGYCQGGCQDFR